MIEKPLMILQDQYFHAYKILSFLHSSNMRSVQKLCLILHLLPRHNHSLLLQIQNLLLHYLSIVDTLGKEHYNDEVADLPIAEEGTYKLLVDAFVDEDSQFNHL